MCEDGLAGPEVARQPDHVARRDPATAAARHGWRRRRELDRRTAAATGDAGRRRERAVVTGVAASARPAAGTGVVAGVAVAAGPGSSGDGVAGGATVHRDVSS